MVTVTSAGRLSGNARCHSVPQSLAPSSRIDSKSSRGMSRMKFDSTSTDSGIAKAIDGRMIAIRVSYIRPRMMIRQTGITTACAGSPAP